MILNIQRKLNRCMHYIIKRYCALNEIVIHNGTICEKCPDYHWPNEETATYCIVISYNHYTFKSTMSLGNIYL